MGAFIFVTLLLCPSSVSSDLTSHARKRKSFAGTKFMWAVDKVINIQFVSTGRAPLGLIRSCM